MARGMELSHRCLLADMCNARGLKTAVEVGTHQAVFAHEFMSRFNGAITLVDPWELAADDNPIFYPNFVPSTENREADYAIAVQAMLPFSSRVTWMLMTSSEAAQTFDDDAVGFVYIDALHDYDSVVEDIRIWYPKVISGNGIFAGHDYDEAHPDVVRAVDAFIGSIGHKLYCTADEPSSWWIVKCEL